MSIAPFHHQPYRKQVSEVKRYYEKPGMLRAAGEFITSRGEAGWPTRIFKALSVVGLFSLPVDGFVDAVDVETLPIPGPDVGPIALDSVTLLLIVVIFRIVKVHKEDTKEWRAAERRRHAWEREEARDKEYGVPIGYATA